MTEPIDPRLAKLTDRDLARIFERLDAESVDRSDQRRKFKRYSYRAEDCIVAIQQPGATSASRHRVRTRNLSEGGISFLHSAFVHQGSLCVVQLEGHTAGRTNQLGRVVNCRYIEQGLHEVAVAFEKPIDLADYCEAAIGFRFLIVDDDHAVAQLAAHHLAQMNVEAEFAENGRVAIEKAAASAFDCILMDIEMPELDGLEATRAIRGAGYAGFIVAMTALSGEEDRAASLLAGCNAHIAKPIGKEAFKRVLEQLRRPPIESAFIQDESMRDLLIGFVQSLPGQLRKLEDALAANEIEQLETLARALKSGGASYGYGPIGEAAAGLEAAASAKESVEQLHEKLRGVVGICMQVRAPAKRDASAA